MNKTTDESDEVMIQEMPRDVRIKFYACVLGTLALVAVGWFFTMHRQFSQVSFVASSAKLREVKEEVADITADAKAEAQVPVAEIQAALTEALAPVQEGVQQRQNAMETIGEIMKEDLESSEE